MIKFKTFYPYPILIHGYRGTRSATEALNEWLEENPNVEIISWQTTPVGDHNELYITIQYKKYKED